MLRQHAFTVLPARQASEALHLAADLDRRIDLLITDIVMPGCPAVTSPCGSCSRGRI